MGFEGSVWVVCRIDGGHLRVCTCFGEGWEASNEDQRRRLKRIEGFRSSGSTP